MKKIPTLIISSVFCLSSYLTAADYYFNLAQWVADVASNTSYNVSSTISDKGDGTFNSYWYTSADYSEASKVTDTSFAFLNNAENSLIFGTNTSSKLENRKLIFDKTVNVNGFKVGRDPSVLHPSFFEGSDVQQVIKIKNFTSFSTNSEALNFSGANTNLKIENITARGYMLGTNASPLEYAEITNITLEQGNNGKCTAFNFTGTESSDINPDLKIGTLNAASNQWVSAKQLALLYCNSNEISGVQTADRDNYVWINSVTGDAGIGVGPTSAASKGSVTYVLRSTTASSTTSSLYQYSAQSTLGASGAKMNLIMRSQNDNDDGTYTYTDGSQTFGGTISYITGNVRLESGSLFINYSGEGNNLTKGNLIFAKANGANVAGFGSSGDVGGTYLFNAIQVADNGGSLIVRFNTDSESGKLINDTISLTNTATGTGTLSIDMRSLNGNTNVDEYIEYIIENDAQKIISWNAFADDTIKFTTSELYQIYTYNGTDYTFTAINGADGLYVDYVAVPEPATIAAIFGALALGFAAYRRRK